MFNLILALTAGIIIGWNFNAFFHALNAPRILREDINLTQNFMETSTPKPIEKIDMNQSQIKTVVTPNVVKKLTPTKHIPKQNSFYTLLHKNLFSDALSLYIDGNEKDVLFYRATLKKYFQKKIRENPNNAIVQIIEYLEIEADNRAIKHLLSDAYKRTKDYENSIIILSELLDTSSGDETAIVEIDLINTTEQYIKLLKKSNQKEEILSFLQAQVDYGLNIPFFSLTLAKEYIAIEEFNSAIKLLKDIEFDEQYGEEAKILLKKIESGTIATEEYTYRLPLTKVGEHFTIEVTAEDTPLTLLLDTGATVTMVNEDKISSLTMLNEHLILKTAGGDITAQLHVAQIFKIGEIELKEFKITTSSFPQEKADGLLGMNFFKQFKFKIDQEEEVLYLSKK
jgi:clan AA aspartic protease (TIGR02281 family)